MPHDDGSNTLVVHPVISYTTAVTSHAMCIVELRVPAPMRDSEALALRFRLGRADAAALGRALLDTVEFATRLATSPREPNGRQ